MEHWHTSVGRFRSVSIMWSPGVSCVIGSQPSTKPHSHFCRTSCSDQLQAMPACHLITYYSRWNRKMAFWALFVVTCFSLVLNFTSGSITTLSKGYVTIMRSVGSSLPFPLVCAVHRWYLLARLGPNWEKKSINESKLVYTGQCMVKWLLI